MSYEYIYFPSRALSIDEFIEKLNEFGEEGYRFIYQNEFGIFLLERENNPSLQQEEIATLSYPQRDQLLRLYAGLNIICLVIIAFVILHWGFHWL